MNTLSYDEFKKGISEYMEGNKPDRPLKDCFFYQNSKCYGMLYRHQGEAEHSLNFDIFMDRETGVIEYQMDINSETIAKYASIDDLKNDVPLLSDSIKVYTDSMKDKIKSDIISVLSKRNPDFNKDKITFSSYPEMLIGSYKPLNEPTPADFDVYFHYESEEVSIHGNLQAIIPTVKYFCVMQDFKEDIEKTPIRRAYTDYMLKDEHAIEEFVKDKHSFDLSYNNPDIDWQIKEAVETAKLPLEKLKTLDEDTLQKAYSVLEGYKTVLSEAYKYSNSMYNKISGQESSTREKKDWDDIRMKLLFYKDNANDYEEGLCEIKDLQNRLTYENQEKTNTNTNHKHSKKDRYIER